MRIAQQVGLSLRGDPRRAGHAAGEPHADPRRLGAPLGVVALAARRTHRPLERLRDDLAGCIGCGCLSLQVCPLYNPGDVLAAKGPGAHILLGDAD